MVWSAESGSKPGTMTGIWCGAKKNKSTGSFKSIASYLTWRSTTSEDGTNYAGKICSTKISKNSSGASTSKTINRNQTSMTSSLPPSNSQDSTSSSSSNSREPKTIIKSYGSWNPPPNAKGKAYSSSIKSQISPDGRPSIRIILLNHMLFKDTYWIRFSLEGESSICVSMLSVSRIIHWQSISIEQGLRGLLMIGTIIRIRIIYISI